MLVLHRRLVTSTCQEQCHILAWLRFHKGSYVMVSTLLVPLLYARFGDRISIPVSWRGKSFPNLGILCILRHIVRISRLEMLDEIEELDLVLEHYAITWGVKLYQKEGQSLDADWAKWDLQLQTVEESDDD